DLPFFRDLFDWSSISLVLSNRRRFVSWPPTSPGLRAEQFHGASGEATEPLHVVLDSSLNETALKIGNQHLGFGFGVGCRDQTFGIGITNRRLKIALVTIENLPDLFANRTILRPDLASQGAIGAAKHRPAISMRLRLAVTNVLKIAAQAVQCRHGR